MGRKPKYTIEQKVKACKEYLSGSKSATQIAKELKMSKQGRNLVQRWVKVYQINGEKIFDNRGGNQSYTKEFKENVVKEYLEGKGSLIDLGAKYSIPSVETVRKWIIEYNNLKELKDYNPHREVYMADKLKTTKEEKLQIIQYCLDHNRDIKGTAAHFGGNYAQIYQWMKKVEKNGEKGLEDRRGHRKKEEELSELEKAQRRIKFLEKQNREKEMEIELLKKVQALDRKF